MNVLLFLCLVLQSFSVNNCIKEADGLCSTCKTGFFVSTDRQHCVELGCSYWAYCISCASDGSGDCTSCASGFSTRTVTGGGMTVDGCYQQGYSGVCAIFGVEGCENGCELDLQTSLDTYSHVWKCLPGEEEVIVEEKGIEFNAIALTGIIGGFSVLACVIVVILVVFLVCT